MLRSNSLFAVSAALIAAALLHACGGSDDSGGGTSGSATVSAYLTDDLGGYESVNLTVNKVELRHPVTPSCEIITGPLPVNAAELGRDEILELVNTTTCPVGPYNRLYVELAEDVTLLETATSQPLDCKFVSYFDDGLPVPMLPNVLDCDSGTCALSITGAVNLIAGDHAHLALDVDLKNFVVNTNVMPCEVTLKVSPVHADGKLAAGFRKRISGTVSGLDAGTDTFTLTTTQGHSFAVRYAGVGDQAGLDQLLERAAADGLRTSVRCQTIDMATTPPTCTAQTDAAKPLKAIGVKAEGAISALDTTGKTFTLSYAAGPTMLPVNYAMAAALGKVMGVLADAATAEATLHGFDAGFFLAREVEVK